MEANLVEQTADAVKWAAALNNVFKSLSIDLETIGVQGGRITEVSDTHTADLPHTVQQTPTRVRVRARAHTHTRACAHIHTHTGV